MVKIFDHNSLFQKQHQEQQYKYMQAEKSYFGTEFWENIKT